MIAFGDRRDIGIKMNIKGAIFDCDGTLVDSLWFWDTFYQKMGQRFLDGKPFTPDAEDDRAVRTQPVSYLARLFHEKYGIAGSPDEISEWFLEISDSFYRYEVELKAGVRELLSHLRECGVRMCVASASEKHLIDIVLSRHGVLDYFEKIVSCTEIGAGKDKPDVFFAAEQLLGTPHGQTYVFEDSLLAIETAKRAGFPVVGVYDSHAFGQDKARELSDEYIGDGESFLSLIPKIKA